MNVRSKKIAAVMAIITVCFTANVYADEVQDYIYSLIGKTIDVSGLYDDYGFVGELVSVHYKDGLVLRIKGIIQKTKSSPKFWESVANRPGAVTIRSPNSDNEAIAIDSVMSIASPILREYDGYDKETDYFVSQTKSLNISDIPVKAMILQRADEEKNDILIQNSDQNEKFKAMVKELSL